MKKITLKALGILLLSFLGFASANAQVTFGTYVSNAFVANTDPTNIGVQDPAHVSFAVKVTDATLQGLLDAASDRVLALGSVRVGDGEQNFFANGGIRFTKGNGEYVYYIEDYDLGDLGVAPHTPVPLAEGATGHLHSNVFVAGTSIWWDECRDQLSWNPADHYLYLGRYAVPGPVFEGEDVATVDIVTIAAYNGDGSLAQYYAYDNGTNVLWSKSTELGESAQYYQIPAGEVNGVQAYYFMNVTTGKYLVNINTEELAGERGGDWPIAKLGTSATKEDAAAYKWIIRDSPWSWGVYISSAANIDLGQAEGNQYDVITSIVLMKLNDVAGNEETVGDFFGEIFPTVTIGGFKGGLGNAWTATKLQVVAESVRNPLLPELPPLVNFAGTIIAINPATQLPLTKVNPNAPFMIAVQVTDEFWQELLDREVTETFEDGFLGGLVQGFYTIALADAKYIDMGGDTIVSVPEFGRAARLYQAPSPAPAHSYFANVPALNPQMANGTTGKITLKVHIAATGKWGYWVDESVADGANVTILAPINFEAITIEDGIYDLAADGSTVTGYYSILGAKLSAEPANGVFIVKYSNGKAVKVVK